MTQKLSDPIRQFAGENRLLPDDLLPPNVGVDGQNMDYSAGTLKKRLGIPKTHSAAHVKGGIRIGNAPTTNNRSLVILDQDYLDLVGEFTVEITVRIESDPSQWTNGGYIITNRSGTDGWNIRYFNSNQTWSFQKVDSSPAFKIISVPGDITSGTNPVVGETYHLAMWRTSGDSFGAQVTRFSDGEVGSATPTTCSGDTASTRNTYVGGGIGAVPGNQILGISVDELRLWDDQRTTTEIDDAKFRELIDPEISDANLIGYWPMNDTSTSQTEDLSQNKNPAFFSSSQPGYVPSLMPNPSSNNFAVQCNGIDNYATAPYNAEYAPVLDTNNMWAVEFWARLDTAIEWPNDAVLLQLGSTTTGNGHLFSVYITWPGSGAAPLLKYSYSTTTTANNTVVTPSTPFNPEPGVPFHVRVQRNILGTHTLYVNGVVIDSTATGNTENGPTTSTSYGMTFLARNSAGTYSLLAPCSIDEVRLWSPLSGPTGLPPISIWDTEYGDTANPTLIGYWKFNADDPLKDTASTSDAVLVPASDDKPTRTHGMVYPSEPSGAIKLIGPVSIPVTTTNTNQGQPLFRRELLVATRQAFLSQQGTTRNWLKDLDVPGSESIYSFVRFQGKLICCNGVGRNYAYNADVPPASLTLPADSDVPVATATGAGSGWTGATGVHTYRFTWYNESLDVEGPYWGEASDTVAGTTDTVEITSVPASVDGYSEVTHWRLYRLDPSATVYRRLAEVAIGTTTYSDTGTDITANTALNTTRTHPDPQSICEVFKNRLFMARGSTLIFSDADTLDFASTSTVFVDRDDGEAITGLKAHFGQLIIFKKTSIYILDGDGPTTFVLRKVYSGVGCLSPHTVAASPHGVYFLGLDGVYLYDGQSPKYISHSQQPLFRRVAHNKGHLAVGTYHPESHQYILSCDLFTEATLDPSKPSQEAYDSADFQSLFTHYYRMVDGTDEVGTGGTISDADVSFSADTDRGQALFQSGGHSTTMTAQSDVSSDWTFGMWRKLTSPIGTSNDTNLFFVGSATLIFEEFLPLYGSTTPYTGRLTLYSTYLAGNKVFSVDITPIKEWVHLAVKKTGTVYTLYVNGTPFISASGNEPAAVSTSFGAIEAPGVDTQDAYIDNFWWVSDTALTDKNIESIYMFETGDAVTEGVTMVFDEETQTWSKRDKRFDCLATAEYTSNTSEALAGLHGFVCRIGESDGDLHRSDGDTAQVYTKTGTLTAASGAKITDASATFPTEGDGFAGAEFVAVPSDDTLEKQRRIIIGNTATELYLDNGLSAEVTGTYYIGPVESEWESPWMDIGSPGLEKVLQYIQVWQRKVTGGTFTFKYKAEEDASYQSLTVSAATQFVRMPARLGGRRIKIRIENIGSTNVFEVKSIQLQIEDKSVVSL